MIKRLSFLGPKESRKDKKDRKEDAGMAPLTDDNSASDSSDIEDDDDEDARSTCTSSSASSVTSAGDSCPSDCEPFMTAEEERAEAERDRWSVCIWTYMSQLIDY